MEIQKQDSHSSHHSLEISPTARDSHIPTASAAVGLRGGARKTKLKCARGKVENKSGFHFPTAPTASGRKEETQKTGTLLKRLDRPDNSTGLERPAQANYQHPGWAKSDDRSGPGRMIKLTGLCAASCRPICKSLHSVSMPPA